LKAFVNENKLVAGSVERAGSGRLDRKFWFLSEALPG